jgi:hypothetical protein
MKLTQNTLELNLFLFVFFILVAFFAGFLYKRKQIIQLSDKLYDSEKELMRVNNEVYDHIEQNKKLEEELGKIKSGNMNDDEKVKDIRLGKIG